MDFQQGAITTIHDYGPPTSWDPSSPATPDPARSEVPGSDALPDAAFIAALKRRPTAVLIPCLFDEFQRPALARIRDVLRGFHGLRRLVIALTADTAEDVRVAERFFRDMPYPVLVHWTNGPAVRELLEGLGEHGLEVSGPPGKGWAVWQGLGVACLDAELVALFDADIRTFSPSYPRRMVQPLLEPSRGIAYVKAFYSRLSLEDRRLQGRATRLFVNPILASLEQLIGPSPFLRYLQAFRYPLAGEFAFTRDLAMNLRIPCDWGLEIGMLSEVYRQVAISRIAQVDLGLFDHKHKQVGRSPEEGLQRMCREILASLLRGLMEHEARALDLPQVTTLEVMYRRIAEDRIRQHDLDSAINALPYDRHGEELAVMDFASLLRPGFDMFQQAPVGQQLPSWSRALALDANLQHDLQMAGCADRASRSRGGRGGSRRPAAFPLHGRDEADPERPARPARKPRAVA